MYFNFSLSSSILNSFIGGEVQAWGMNRYVLVHKGLTVYL